MTSVLPYLTPSEERRLVLRVLAYWQDLRGERQFPSVGNIDSAYMGQDWSHCALIERRLDNNRYQFTRMGHAIVPPGIIDGLNMPVDAEKFPAGSTPTMFLEVFPKVLQKKVPVSMGREMKIDGHIYLGRLIVAPLSSDDKNIDGFLAAINWKSISQAEDV